jgi:hypothetical protein
MEWSGGAACGLASPGGSGGARRDEVHGLITRVDGLLGFDGLGCFAALQVLWMSLLHSLRM